MEIESSQSINQAEATRVNQTGIKIDIKVILKLLRNPLDSLKLTERDLSYGIIGLVSAYVAFLIWSLLASNRLNDLINPYNNLMSLFTEQSSGSEFFKMFSKLLLTGLWGITALLLVIWLMSWWTSGQKPEIKLFITHIGGIHFLGCAGFIIASIVSASLTLSIIVIAITLLTILCLTLYSATELYSIPQEKLSLFFLASIAGYVIVFSFIPQLLL